MIKRIKFLGIPQDRELVFYTEELGCRILTDQEFLGAKLVEQLRTERDLPILAAFTLADADHHAFLVDVLWTQTTQLGAAHTSGVQGHGDSAVPQVAGGVDEARHFLSAQYDGDLSTWESRKGQIIAQEALLQDLVEQEPQRGCMHRDRPGVELPLLQKVQLIFRTCSGPS